MSTVVPAEHPVACEGCKAFPIVGVRYQSTKVPSVDLCRFCVLKPDWPRTHGPFAMHNAPPTHSARCGGCNVSPIVGPLATSTKDPEFHMCHLCARSGKFNRAHGPFNVLHGTATHHGTTCFGCHVSPIVGPRVMSETKPTVNLCGSCAVSGRHNSSLGPFRIRIEPPYVHPGVACQGCKAPSIVGPRYQSTKDPTTDFCARCHAQRTDVYGPFFVWQMPAVHEGVSCSECNVLAIAGTRYKSTQDNLCPMCYSSGKGSGDFTQIETAAVHDNVSCSDCRTMPIRGIRYRSLSTRNYNLCRTCVEIDSSRGPFQLHLTPKTRTTRMTPLGTGMHFLLGLAMDTYRVHHMAEALLGENGLFGDDGLDEFQVDVGDPMDPLWSSDGVEDVHGTTNLYDAIGEHSGTLSNPHTVDGADCDGSFGEIVGTILETVGGMASSVFGAFFG
ncbi:hypothetical protein SPRG_16859 [Saprolegnia parasitica CBS 223.65]|uniref:ZZ-type domain-containing protein n=1 Tax=Saprolegnia parasitica (strain CBS 223.65) TaxID=695850 RepID=A0A067BTM1_SAPPC|nr:hypothetical protein SPRG_16859 [Saprolegnia parasitica CBS 223.65]KDO17621.1 hypothetical protein SPRG_16859 [Saprolegnia parasitica CBS 223.65]|eukprot:XP_012211671.1 hypothetical protein SPRG_16859 [Saprolegnia parasitica CBS 223.65]